jgi:glycosyltransferase involved in cell wall biosynthesis
MRIGIMLRALDEKGGIGVYTRYLTEELLQLDRRNDYFLFYRNSSHLGRFAHYENVTEKFIRGSNKALWDQIKIPYACWEAKIDVLFHPKFTVPLLAPCKTVMVLHGAGWFFPEHSKFWKSWDLKYVRMMMPIYCRSASAVMSISKITTDRFNELFHLPVGKIKTVYFGPGKHFRRVDDRSVLEAVKAKYSLPDKFILTLQRYGDGGRKNIDGILKAYEKVYEKFPHKLVIGGKDCEKFRDDYQIPTDGYGKNIVFPGWIDQEDLPVFYSLAELFLYPSNMEAFPIPITEAMACGTPIVTSNQNGLKELAGDAAFFVDPRQPEDIARAIDQVLSDLNLQRSLTALGLQRSLNFRWEKCARETLAILEQLQTDTPEESIIPTALN